MKTLVFLGLIAVLSSFQPNSIARVLKSIKSAEHSPDILITDDVSHILQQRGIFKDVWGRIKGPLQHIGKQTILGLGAIAAKAIEQAAKSSVEKRGVLDQSFKNINPKLDEIVRSLIDILQTTDFKEGQHFLAGSKFGKRSIFGDIFKNIQMSLQLAGENTVQSLVGMLLQDIEHGPSDGKRHASKNLSKQLKRLADSSAQPATDRLANVLDTIIETLINTFGQIKRNVLDDTWNNVESKRNVFNDIWNKARGPLEQIGRQTTVDIVAAIADLVKHALYKDTAVRTSKAITSRQNHPVSGVAMTTTGKRNILDEQWKEQSETMMNSATSIADTVMADVQHNIPTFEL